MRKKIISNLLLALQVLGVICIGLALFDTKAERDIRVFMGLLFFGIGLIMWPLKTIQGLLFCILIFAIPFGFGYVGSRLGLEILGKGFPQTIGFISGLVIGVRFLMSNLFHKIIDALSIDDNL